MQCQGRELGDKGVSDRHKCGFKVTLEFVTRVDDGDSPGWVLKKVEGGLHERESDGNMHQLTRTTWEAQADAVLSGGNSQLSSESYGWYGVLRLVRLIFCTQYVVGNVLLSGGRFCRHAVSTSHYPCIESSRARGILYSEHEHVS